MSFLSRVPCRVLVALCVLAIPGRSLAQFEVRGQFLAQPSSGPVSIAVGDFNHDGILDLAVVSYCCAGTGVAILMGRGDGTFDPAVVYAAGDQPFSVVAADFNHDGNLDLAVANSLSPYLTILLGNGDGTFHPSVSIATLTAPISLAVGDFNNDGLADLAVAYLPARRDSAVATVFGLPRSARAAAALAGDGRPVPVPLLRDDAGGVLLGRGELREVRGESYCDEHLVLRGGAARFTVSPDPSGGLLVEARPPGLLRATRAWRGRAVQLACEPARVWLDGVPHPRPVTRWTWYRHTADWLLVRR